MPETARIVDHPKKSTPLPDLSGPAASNGPDRDEFLFMVGQLAKADAAVAQAKLDRKKLRQHFGNSGVNLTMMDLAIKEAEREDGTTINNMRDFKRYAEFLGLPIGTQISLFDAPPRDASPDLEAGAFKDGRERGLKGQNPDEQKWMPMTPEGQAHLRGWREGQDVVLSKFKDLQSGLKLAEQEAAKARAAKKAARAAERAGAGSGTGADDDLSVN